MTHSLIGCIGLKHAGDCAGCYTGLYRTGEQRIGQLDIQASWHQTAFVACHGADGFLLSHSIKVRFSEINILYLFINYFFNICRISSLTPKLTKHMRKVVEELIIQLNNSMQIRLIDKFTVGFDILYLLMNQI